MPHHITPCPANMPAAPPLTRAGGGFDAQDYADDILVTSGRTASGVQLSGDYMSVQGDGARAQDTALVNGAWQDVAFNRLTGSAGGGGVATATHLGTGTKQFVYSGGTASDTAIASGATAVVFNGGVTSGAIACGIGFRPGGEKNEGALLVQSGGSSVDALVSGGYLSVQGQNAFSDGAVITANGWQDVGFSNRTDAQGGGTAHDTLLISGGRQYVSNGVATQTIIASGGTQQILPGGMAELSVVSSGGIMSVENWGSSYNTVVVTGGSALIRGNGIETVTQGIGSGVTVTGNGFFSQDGTGVLSIGSGGTGIDEIADGGYMSVEGDGACAINALVTGNGWQDVAHNDKTGANSVGIAIGTRLTLNGRQYVYSGGTAAHTSVGSSGSMTVFRGGTALDPALASAGTLELQSGGVLLGGIVQEHGIVRADGAQLGGKILMSGYLDGGTIIDQGIVEVAKGGLASHLIVGSGGSLQIDPGGQIADGISLQTGGQATIDASVSGSVDLAADGYAKLIVTGRSTPNLVITGFNGAARSASDQIVLRDIPRAEIRRVDYPDADHVAFVLTDGSTVTFAVPGVRSQGFSLDTAPDGSTIFEVCFLAGTLIATPQGNRAVETLMAGDPVLIERNGQQQAEALIWTGQRRVRTVSGNAHEPENFPVRIRANALGPAKPFTDLLVTPEHCLYLDGCLVPARMLVNGKSIIHDETLVDYTYYHLETQQHSLLISNGVISESYLDTGNRSRFVSGSSLSGPDTHAKEIKSRPEDMRVAPLNVEAAFVKQHWDRFAMLAGIPLPMPGPATLAHAKPGIHLAAQDGRCFEPSRIAGRHHVFRLPGDVSWIRLVSETHNPSRRIGPWINDRRALGVLVGQVLLYASHDTREIDIHSPHVIERGWHSAEPGPYRWTNGDAGIDLGVHNDHETMVLCIEIGA